MKFRQDAVLACFAVNIVHSIAAYSLIRETTESDKQSRHGDKTVPRGRKAKSSKSSKGTSSSSSKSSIEFTLDNVDELLKYAALKNDPQPTLQGLKALVQTDPTCHTGTVAEVETACNGECCTPAGSCKWNGDATICEGSCEGTLACDDIPTNSVVMAGSCRGKKACSKLGGDDAVADFVPVFIAPDACVGETVGGYSCTAIGEEAETVILSKGSCDGYSTCAAVGKSTSKSIFVGAESCNGYKSCLYVAKYGEVVEVFVGSEACQGRYACNQMAEKETSSKLVYVGDESCIDYVSCDELGVLSAVTVKIGKKSCIGKESCGYVGYNATRTIVIGKDSCDEYKACTALGYLATSIAVGDGACTGEDYKCFKFGAGFKGEVFVNDNVCSSSAEVCCTAVDADGENICVNGFATFR